MKRSLALLLLFLQVLNSCQNHSESANQLFDKANIELENDNYSESLKLFLETKKVDSTFKNIDSFIGMNYYILENRDSSLKYLNYALLKDTSFYQSKYFRGQVYFDREQYELAIKDFESVLQYETEAHMLFLIGKSYLAMVEPEKAIQYFNESIELNDTDYYWYQSRAIAYHLLDEYDSVIKDCDLALSLNQNDGSVYLTKAFACFELGDTVEACENFYKAEQLTEIDTNHILFQVCNN